MGFPPRDFLRGFMVEEAGMRMVYCFLPFILSLSHCGTFSSYIGVGSITSTSTYRYLL
ncbi:hypothetical protein BJ508DRAFT_412140, partial [Ascobolus immersus RN42]